MIRTVTTYITSDNMQFTDPDEARDHEKTISLRDTYNADPLPGITPAQMGAWLTRNKPLIKLFFGFKR